METAAMNSLLSPTAIMVMTARGPARIKHEGGTQAWALNPDNARKHPYVVCVQNQHNGPWGGATEPHNTAFLIGRVSSIEPSPERPERYIIRMSEYARIAVHVVWPGRNPVRYVTLSDFGIDPSKLEFKPMPQPAKAQEETTDENGDPFAPETPAATPNETMTGLIPEFQQNIASILGIQPSQVRITIEA